MAISIRVLTLVCYVSLNIHLEIIDKEYCRFIVDVIVPTFDPFCHLGWRHHLLPFSAVGPLTQICPSLSWTIVLGGLWCGFLTLDRRS